MERWSFGRRIRFLVWLSVPFVIGAGAAIVLVASGLGEPLRRRPTFAGLLLTVGWAVVTTLVAVLQTCPRCHNSFNAAFFAGTPYSRACMYCGLRADAPSRRLGVGRSLAILLTPAILVSSVVLAMERYLPPPTVYTVTMAELLELRGKSRYVTIVGAVAKPELAGSYVKITQSTGGRSGGSHVVYQVVPLVPRKWRSAPVRVWILCQPSPETGNCADPSRFLELLQAHEGPLVNAFLIPHGDVTKAGSGWERSTTDARIKHDVTSHLEALFVSWPHHPERE